MTVTTQGLTAAEKSQLAKIDSKFIATGKKDALDLIRAGIVQSVVETTGIQAAIAAEVRTIILQANGGKGLDPKDF